MWPCTDTLRRGPLCLLSAATCASAVAKAVAATVVKAVELVNQGRQMAAAQLLLADAHKDPTTCTVPMVLGRCLLVAGELVQAVRLLKHGVALSDCHDQPSEWIPDLYRTAAHAHAITGAALAVTTRCRVSPRSSGCNSSF